MYDFHRSKTEKPAVVALKSTSGFWLAFEVWVRVLAQALLMSLMKKTWEKQFQIFKIPDCICMWLWVKKKTPRDRRFWSIFPFTNSFFWYPFFSYLFPIWVKSSADKERPDCHVPYNSKEADLLHPSRKSLKNQAHTLRGVVRFLEGFFPFKLTPTYQKVHSRSLINLGFADAIHGGFCRRPLLPNPEVTSHFLQQYADHEEQQVPMTIEAAFVTTELDAFLDLLQSLNVQLDLPNSFCA